jgi:hypothetical protein
MMKPKPISIALMIVFFAAPLTAQRQPRFSGKYVRPVTYGGLFYVQRGDGIIIDPEAGYDPRALVPSYNNKSVDHKPNDPDAPTHPGFYLSYAARFDFERVEVIGKQVHFKTHTIAGVYYRFSGVMGTERMTNFDHSAQVPFIKGVLTRINNRKVVSQESIKFVHAVIA